MLIVVLSTVYTSSAVPTLDIAYYRDTTNQLTLQEITDTSFAPHFQTASSPQLNFGMSPDTYWMRIKIRSSDTEVRSWYITIGYPLLDTIYFYQSTPQGVELLYSAGDKLISDQIIDYRQPLFPITLSDSLPNTYYLKVRTQGTTQIPLKIHAQDDMLSTIVRSELLEGLFYGAMLLMVMYNLFLFASLREKSYLFYCLFVAGNTFVLANLQGQLTIHFFQPSEWYDHFSVSSFFFTVFWALVFGISFLQVRRYAPQMYIALLVSVIISGIGFLASYILPYYLSARLIVGLVAFTPLVLWWTGVTAWRNGNTSARFFVFAWSLYLLAVIFISFRNLGLIDDQVHLENIIQIGAVTEALLLSIALADKINLFRAEKIDAQQRALQVSLENEQIIRNQNQVLEDRIQERTSEILEQNEELHQQQEVIEELNRQLVLYSENLENEVSARTVELTKANKRLVQQNSRLDRFAYIVSHNLRGPIARIQGMITILDKNNLTAYNLNCFSHLEKTADRLDAVIKDLNQILIYKNSTDYQSARVPLRATIKKVLKEMQATLVEEKVTVHNNVGSTIAVLAIESYLKKVVEQLLSNAIQYRSEERPIEIEFDAYPQGNQIVFCISDNGMGIDLEKHQDKVFGLYQQFHLQQEGRGVGLYLAKTQIETMGGQIGVSSTVGEGTIFRIHLDTSTSNQEVAQEERSDF
ncbi:sensor histidine kinase [Tunicatimonas pelagia]|uniref:sensor histidine kinase n=1 Tax=Tunicatimonas pelagia TaxID=931531 RepID=UPI002665A8CA|nr:sensor histidine kinase [Tunicatimonas pelagia]WKN44527.1 sensor histidine kinase [Tunicatimonas pelagia]